MYKRQGLLDEALRDRVHLYVLNFLKILCEKGTLRELPGCARAYRVRYNQAHGILEAAATTEVAMTEQQVKSLHAKLEKLTGKTIDLKTKVDPAVDVYKRQAKGCGGLLVRACAQREGDTA